MEAKTPDWAPNTLTGELANLKHLKPVFGRKLVVDIDPKDIRSYQDDRLEEEASPKTINNEIGTLRSILRRSGAWARIQPEVSMLPPGEEIGKAITPEEERALLDACGKSRSRSLLPFVILTLETGAQKEHGAHAAVEEHRLRRTAACSSAKTRHLPAPAASSR